MSLHRIREGDDRPYFRVVLKVGGVVVDLTGATSVTFRMMDESGINKITGLANIITPTAGLVEFRFDSTLGHTNTPGNYIASWTILFADGTEQTIPTRGRDRVQVIQRVA